MEPPMSFDDLKRQIKEYPISQILSHYVPLVEKGRDIKCCCPFHDDKNPSMHINNTKGMYWCFPCQKGGDAINFVMELKHLDFLSALKDIAINLNLPIEEAPSKSPSRKDKAQKLLKKALALYTKDENTFQNETFQAFLSERKLSKDLALKYSLGFSPKGNPILSMIREIPPSDERVYMLELAREIGLINQNEYGEYYDFFRERIMFPIFDHQGTVVGFSARATKSEDEQKAKYLNSKNSLVFNKSEILFGLNLAKESILEKGSVIIVEGQMDQIALSSAGILNTVATMGLTLSEENLSRLLNLSSEIFLCLDSDNAGVKGSQEINKAFLQKGIIPKVLNLSPSKNADEFLKVFGTESLKTRLLESRLLIDTQIDSLITKDSYDIPDRLKTLKSVFEILAPLGYSLESTERILDASKRLRILSPASDILSEYKVFLER